ncbi:hypothetical protein [Methanosphaerula subterraneus]|uniref:hypothetical protein n=1 Tax=Methanosphaerula subterraneus TaxID=3350244 RepID=UPI003F844521
MTHPSQEVLNLLSFNPGLPEDLKECADRQFPSMHRDDHPTLCLWVVKEVMTIVENLTHIRFSQILLNAVNP